MEPSAVSSSRTNSSIGLFCGQAVVNPAVEDVGPLGLDQSAVGTEDVGELEGPEVDKLGALEQRIHQLHPLVGGLIGHETRNLFRLRQDPEDIEIDATDELLIGADFRRGNPHPVQLGEDRAVDQVVLRDLGDLEAGNLDQVGQANRGHQVEIVGDHGDFATPLELDEAVGVNRGDLGIRGVVVANGGDVAGCAVGVVNQDNDLLRLGRGVQVAIAG